MKLAVFFSLFVVAASNSLRSRPDLDEHWQHFKNVFKKSYAVSEEARRRSIWEDRVDDISKHNLRADMGFHSYRRGLNKYSDLSHEEYMTILNGFRFLNRVFQGITGTKLPSTDTKVPDQVDWLKAGLVTPVKDQGECGACWAFSATGALEGQQQKKTGRLVSLSEQNLVDCCKENNGCNGGDMETAFKCINTLKGIDTEKSYPYLQKMGICHFNPSKVGATCQGYVHIPMGDEEALKHAVATVGPISVAVDAHHESFHDYKMGVFDEPECGNDLTDLTHALLVVGYGTEDGRDYWMAKNSWGKSYGLNGYIKMSRNRNNQCGIATKASFPIL